MNEDSIFLVICENGEYSDYTTWISAAYLNRANAEMGKKELEAERDKIESEKREWIRKRRAYAKPFLDSGQYKYIWDVPISDEITGPWPNLSEFTGEEQIHVSEVPLEKIGQWGDFRR